jgi:hypothetical protein
MNTNITILIIVTILFYSFGGMVDYWQSARHHNMKIPFLLKKYFAFFWLIMYSGILPFLLVYSAANFDNEVALKFTGAFLIGSVVWDILFALLKSGRPVVDISDYWFWGEKNYGLRKNHILFWHGARMLGGILIIF